MWSLGPLDVMRLSETFYCVIQKTPTHQKNPSYNDSPVILILFEISLECCMEVLVLHVIGSATNASGQHFPLYKSAGSSGVALGLFQASSCWL